jgi:hypothetical protein
MAAQTWTSIKQTVAIALTQAQTPYATFPDNFNAQFPLGISWAEDRITNKVPLLATRQTVTLNGATTPYKRSISIGNFETVEQFSLIIGAFLTDNDGNILTDETGKPLTNEDGPPTFVAYDPVSLDFINRYWPYEANTAEPYLKWWGGRYYALADNATVIIAPSVNSVYNASVVGLVQAAGLSPTNTTTYLSDVYPGALISGCLVYLAGALTRNFGAQADEPRQAVSWKNEFEEWLMTIEDNERRLRGLAPNMPQPARPEAARQAQ